MSVRSWGRVRDCMRKEVTEVDGTLDVLSALKIMKEVGATSLIVRRRDESDEYGLLLFSDIAKKVIARDRAPERVNVYEVMAKPVLSVRPDMEIRYCARLFENFNISHARLWRMTRLSGSSVFIFLCCMASCRISSRQNVYLGGFECCDALINGNYLLPGRIAAIGSCS